MNSLLVLNWIQSLNDKIKEKPDAFLTVIILIGAFIIAMIVVLVFHLVSSKENEKADEGIRKNTLNVTEYIYHYDTKLITYFNENEPDAQSVVKDIGFYNKLSSVEEQNKVRQWLEGYATGSKVDQPFVTIHTSYGEKKTAYLSVLRVESVNKEKKIVHFEIVTLPAIRMKKTRNRRNPDSTDLRKIDEVRVYATAKKKPRKFTCYYIILTQYVNGSADMANGKTLYVASILQPINGLQKYLSRHSATVLMNDREAAVFDFGETDVSSVNAMCNTILDEISRFFSVKGLGDMYHVAVGVSHYDGTERFDKAVEHARKLAKIAEEREDTDFLIEGEREENEVYFENTTSGDLDKMIRNSTFRLYFTPILRMKEDASPLYQLYVDPYGVADKSFYEIQRLAFKQGKLGELYEKIFKRMEVLSKNVGKAYYIVPTIITGIPQIHKVLTSGFPEFKDYIVFTVSSPDVKEIVSARLDFRTNMTKARESGARFGLYFSRPEISLPPEVLDYFDLFLVKFPNTKPLYQSEDKILEVMYVQKLLLPHKKEIIFDGLSNAYDICFGTQIGISSFKAESLEGASSLPYQDDSWKDQAFGNNDEENPEQDYQVQV